MTRKDYILKFLCIYCIFSSVFNIHECVGFNCHLPEGCQLEKIYFGNTLNFNEKTNSKYLAMVCNVPNQQFGFKFKEPTPLKTQNNSCDMNIDESNSTYHFQTTIVRWKSSELGILDKTLNLTNALRYFQFFLHYVILTFHNFKGFDLKIIEDDFDSNQHSYLSNMAFIGIRLDFYHNRKKINSCKEIIDLKLKPIKSVFQISGDTRAGKNRIFDLKDVEYTSKICPLVFENANIYRLILSNLVDSFYKKSLLTFEELNYTSLNSDIKYIQIQNAINIDINLNLLNPLVFNKTLYFAVFSEYEVNSISEEIFKVFKNLLSIALNPILFKKINHKQGINWIRQINSDVNVNISNFKVREIQKATPKQLLMVSLVYLNKRISKLFPEEDFCLYVDFPFNQLVIFYDNIASSFEKKTGVWIIDNDRITCTYLWLIQHYGYYYRLFRYWNSKDNAENMLKVINSTAFKSISKCEFEKMKSLCDKSSYQLRNDWDESEFLILNKKLETAFKISLYLVSFLGLFTNSIVIVVILFKDNSDLFKEFKQYSYLCLNSLFCLLISLIEILSWMSECFYPFEVFCPEIRKLAGIQFFKIIFKECFVTMFRFMCSFSYVAFALNRISLIGKDHGKIVTFMSEVGIKKYIICAIFTSCVLSWIKFFKYEVNYFYPDANYPLSNEMNVISSESIQFNDFYFTYNSISDIFNYLVFVAICVTIDICMVVQLRRTLSEKAKKSESMSQKQNQAKKAEYEEAVNKAIRMVVLNGAIGFLFKLPVSVIPVINMAAQFYYKNAISLAVNPGFNEFYLMLYNTRLNDILRDFVDLLYTLSLSIQMFIYNRFDKKFAIGFDRVKEKAFTSIKNRLKCGS